MQKAILFILSYILFTPLCSQSVKPDIVRTYSVPLARQAVALDSMHFYVINNNSITKHLKKDGKLISTWEDKDSMIHHLNSGIIIKDKLYSINSNYPDAPMASSIEIFDPVSLRHIGNHSFGILNGSATWLDNYDGFWYVAFAHYTGRGSEPGKNNSWTRLVKFDEEWRQLESWIYPKKLLEVFNSMSNSGGLILPDGRILCTGHDNYELYLLEFPTRGYSLSWKDTFAVGSYGQGISCEKAGDSLLIYGIIKKQNKVVLSRINL